MSYNTNQTWCYQFAPNNKIHLWEITKYAAVDVVGGYKVKLPDETFGRKLIYPDEDITNGLRVEYSALDEPFITEELESISVLASGIITFTTTTITGAGTDDGFANSDKVRIIGSASNDGDYTVASSGSDGTHLVFAASTFTEEALGESITIYKLPTEATSPTEASHLNFNRMLSLACVDFVKAMMGDSSGDIQKKEYYMKEFWKKVGDNNSNKRNVSMTHPVSNYALI